MGIPLGVYLLAGAGGLWMVVLVVGFTWIRNKRRERH